MCNHCLLNGEWRVLLLLNIISAITAANLKSLFQGEQFQVHLLPFKNCPAPFDDIRPILRRETKVGSDQTAFCKLAPQTPQSEKFNIDICLPPYLSFVHYHISPKTWGKSLGNHFWDHSKVVFGHCYFIRSKYDPFRRDLYWCEKYNLGIRQFHRIHPSLLSQKFWVNDFIINSSIFFWCAHLK